MRLLLFEDDPTLSRTLTNGLRVVTEAVPNARSTSVALFIPVGSRHEDEAHEPPRRLGPFHVAREEQFVLGRTIADLAREALDERAGSPSRSILRPAA